MVGKEEEGSRQKPRRNPMPQPGFEPTNSVERYELIFVKELAIDLSDDVLDTEWSCHEAIRFNQICQCSFPPKKLSQPFYFHSPNSPADTFICQTANSLTWTNVLLVPQMKIYISLLGRSWSIITIYEAWGMRGHEEHGLCFISRGSKPPLLIVRDMFSRKVSPHYRQITVLSSL